MAAPTDNFEELLAAWLAALDCGADSEAASLLAAHPEQAAALLRAKSRLQRSGLIDAPAAAPEFPEQLGEFRLLQRIGSGGMGIVFLAEQASLRRKVAVKLVRPELMLSPVARERFQREVATVAQLQHPGIVPVLAVGQHQGMPYFAMEYVVGCSLDEVVLSVGDRAPQSLDGSAFARAVGALADHGRPPTFADGPWWVTCVRVIAAVAETVAFVHARGILHRDLKPSNVMVTPQGHALLLDFGLAHSANSSPLTRSGAQLGSLPYMSPEQLRGEALDERTDVYSLGVALYQLLALRLPFEASGEEALRTAIITGRTVALIQRNPQLPRDLCLAVATAIDVDRHRRYPSMAAFGADLRAVLAGNAIMARPVSLATRVSRWQKRHPFAAGALLTVALMLLALPVPIAAREIDRRTVLEEAQQVAIADLSEARRAIDLLRDQASLLPPARHPAATALWRQMMKSVHTFYADLSVRHPNDVEVGRAAAEVACALGYERIDAGDLAAGQLHLQDARAASEADPEPRSPAARVLAAKVEGLAARLAYEAFAIDLAASHAERRLAILEAHIADVGDDPLVHLQIGDAENSLANIRGLQGRRSEKIALLRSALARKRQWVGHASPAAARASLAMQCNNLGEMLLGVPECRGEAEPLFQEALRNLADLEPPWGDHPDTRITQAEVHCGLGTVASHDGRKAEAEAAYALARSILIDLITAEPASLVHPYCLVRTEVECGEHRLRAGDPGGAAAAAREAIAVADRALQHGESEALRSMRQTAVKLLANASGG